MLEVSLWSEKREYAKRGIKSTRLYSMLTRRRRNRRRDYVVVEKKPTTLVSPTAILAPPRPITAIVDMHLAPPRCCTGLTLEKQMNRCVCFVSAS